ncbi:MAG: IS66 family transposase [Acidobacteriaceae bacterium]
MRGRTSRHHVCTRCSAGDWPPRGKEPARSQDLLLQENEKLRKQVAEQEQQIAEQQEQIGDLQRRLTAFEKNSSNSSKPPSSDGPFKPARARRPRPRSKRKPGGQLGHPGHWRPQVPPDQVQQVVPVLPLCCKGCGQSLPQRRDEIQEAGRPCCHQVTELPPIQPYVIEYQCHQVSCPHCGETTQAPLPAQVQGQFAPQLMALIAYLTVVCRMPRRVLESFLEEALNISVSLGSTQNIWQRVSAAVAQPCQELEEQLKQETVLNSDETGWRSHGQRRYLWALVARAFVFHTVAQTRSSEVLIHLLGAVFAGILCSDRCSAYFKYQKGRAQLCWAHLKRDILGIQDFAKTTEAERFARDALALYAHLFRLWRKFQGNLITRDQLEKRSLRLQKDWFALAERHLDSEDRAVCDLATALFQHSDRLFTFLQYPGVEPTNNAAERALRIAVQWRKSSFGNRSALGASAISKTAACKCTLRNGKTITSQANPVGRF